MCVRKLKLFVERVREYFRKKGIDKRIQEFGTPGATVALAAGRAGVCR